MKSKYYTYVIALISILVFIEGIRGEFLSPTIYDYIKWLCFVILLTSYIIHRAIRKRK